MTESTTTTLEPVVREVVVRAPVATCFRVFVDEFASWWPPEHHIGEDRTITAVAIEPFVGGRCYDLDTDGVDCQWGTVLGLDPPHGLVLAWHIQGDWTIDLDPELQSEVEVTFVETAPASGQAEVGEATLPAGSARGLTAEAPDPRVAQVVAELKEILEILSRD